MNHGSGKAGESGESRRLWLSNGEGQLPLFVSVMLGTNSIFPG